jgi:hypothetical protein
MEIRTIQQNKMLHALFKQIAGKCNESGITVQQLISETFEIEVTPEIVKSITKQLTDKIIKKSSTTKYDTNDIDMVIDMWVNKLAKDGIELELPE